MTNLNLASYIDHTLLAASSSQAQIKNLCSEAKVHTFKSVCINPSWVKICRDELKGSAVLVCTVIGFPLGATLTESKVAETKLSLTAGADEFDMVINIGRIKSKDWDYVLKDMSEVVKAAQGKTVKVILETCLLTDDEIIKSCELAVLAGVHFVKTSTGFSTAGATTAHVQLMKKSVGDKAQVKASGGVRDFSTAIKMIEAGAARLGTSSGIAIIQDRSESDANNY
jgi:deoxyribose-phosphate aldolase